MSIVDKLIKRSKENIRESEGVGTSVDSRKSLENQRKREMISKKSADLRLKHQREREALARQSAAVKEEIEKVVTEGAPIVVALAPIDIRNPKKAPQPYRNKGDIVPPTKPPSTEKRGVKGRPGQRPMPTHEEIESLDELSSKKMSDYSDKASGDVHRLDKEGNTKKANKRFDGVVRASDKMTDAGKKLRGTSIKEEELDNIDCDCEECRADMSEDLRNWFNKNHPDGDWKRVNTKGEVVGPCAREPGEPKPKCMSKAKRAALSKKEKANAVRTKRKHDPDPERKGDPINVSSYGKGKISEDMKTEKKTPSHNAGVADDIKRITKDALARKKANESKLTKLSNEENVDEACWDTHKQVGMKKKGGRMVPDCVPKNEGVDPAHKKILDKEKTSVPKSPKGEYERKVVTYLKKKYPQGAEFADKKRKERLASNGRMDEEVKIGDKVSFNHPMRAIPGKTMKKIGTVGKIEGDTVHVRVKDKYGVIAHKKNASELTKEDVRVDEGFFDSLKRGYATGMQTSLKKKIKPEHHSSYDIASVKSTSDATSILQKAKQAGHHIKEDVEHLEEKNVPTSPDKWARAIAMAKSKFDVYPSAYANGWAAKKYKEMGGGWKSVKEETIAESGGDKVFKNDDGHIEKYGENNFAVYLDGKKQKSYDSLEAAKKALASGKEKDDEDDSGEMDEGMKPDHLKPGWMLRKDPELAKKLKDKQNLAKKRQQSYGDQKAGVSVKEEAEQMDEASKYQIYHPSYTSAVQHAVSQVEKQGFKIDMDDYERKVAFGPRKPSSGKTNSFSITLMDKNGKISKKQLQMQVYGMEGGKYELNMYTEEVEHITELSKKTLGSYVDKAIERAREMPGTGTNAEGSKKTKRFAAVSSAAKRIQGLDLKKEYKSEGVNEAEDKPKKSYKDMKKKLENTSDKDIKAGEKLSGKQEPIDLKPTIDNNR